MWLLPYKWEVGGKDKRSEWWRANVESSIWKYESEISWMSPGNQIEKVGCSGRWGKAAGLFGFVFCLAMGAARTQLCTSAFALIIQLIGWFANHWILITQAGTLGAVETRPCSLIPPLSRDPWAPACGLAAAVAPSRLFSLHSSHLPSFRCFDAWISDVFVCWCRELIAVQLVTSGGELKSLSHAAMLLMLLQHMGVLFCIPQKLEHKVSV